MDTVCAAGLCVVTGFVVLAVLLTGSQGETQASRRDYQPRNSNFDPFELRRRSDEQADSDRDQNPIYYHRGWMEYRRQSDDHDGPYSRHD